MAGSSDSTAPRAGVRKRRACELEACGKQFVPRRSDQKYHDEKCKTQAWRERNKGAADTEVAAPPDQAVAQSPVPAVPVLPALAPPEPTASVPPVATPPRPARQVLEGHVQEVRRANGLRSLEPDHLLNVLALQEAVRQILAEPEVQEAVQRMTAQGRIAILSGVVKRDALASAELGELADEQLSRMGLAAVRLDARHVAVAVVAAGNRPGVSG